MPSHLLEPLALKLVSDLPEKTSFPYQDFSPQPPIGASEQTVEVSPTTRIEQLEKMLAEKHTFDANQERESYDKAYMSGEKAGLALGQKRAEQILDKMEKLQGQTQQQLDEIRDTMCEAVIDISGMIAEWLVGEITADDRARLLTMAEKAARSFPETEKMIMVVNKNDYSEFEKLLSESDFTPHLLTDNEIKPGCVRIANEAQDVLIDPRAPIAEAVAQLKRDLLSSGDSLVSST